MDSACLPPPASSAARPLFISPLPTHPRPQMMSDVDEKASTPDRTHQSPLSSSTRLQNYRFPQSSSNPSLDNQPRTAWSSQQCPQSFANPSRCHGAYTRRRALRLAHLTGPWLPIIMYGITSLAFVVAIALFRPELFSFLDDLSHWLKADEQFGYAVLFSLIFITTIPPVPLYSTLITLSGYTFGPWTGAVISYFAALSGALTVFVISRSFFRDTISRWLSATITIKRVVCAVEKRPKLLFLIRLAPYPYNVMNCLLAAAPTLTLRTYTTCTALSLFKVIIHTSMGASIHSFKDYHGADPNQSDEKHEHSLAELWTALGMALCIAILVYLSVVARRAVDDELDDEPITSYDAEETIGFLAQSESTRDLEAGEEPMTESSFRPSQHPVSYQPSTERDIQWISQSRI